MGGVGKADQLGATDRPPGVTAAISLILRPIRGDAIQVESGPGGAQVGKGAQPLGGGHYLGQRLQDAAVGLGKPFFHQGPEAADEIDARLAGGLVQGPGQVEDVTRLAPGDQPGGRGDGECVY